MFIVEPKDEQKKYIAIENTNGNCWVEEFKTDTACYIWLLGITDVEPLVEAEKTEGWY